MIIHAVLVLVRTTRERMNSLMLSGLIPFLLSENAQRKSSGAKYFMDFCQTPRSSTFVSHQHGEQCYKNGEKSFEVPPPSLLLRL